MTHTVVESKPDRDSMIIASKELALLIEVCQWAHFESFARFARKLSEE